MINNLSFPPPLASPPASPPGSPPVVFPSSPPASPPATQKPDALPLAAVHPSSRLTSLPSQFPNPSSSPQPMQPAAPSRRSSWSAQPPPPSFHSSPERPGVSPASNCSQDT